MKVGFIGCWCDMKIYAIQASNIRRSLEKLLRARIKVVTSNCGCFYGSLPEVLYSPFNYRSLLADQDVSAFVKIPHFRFKEGSGVKRFIKGSYAMVSEPMRAQLYSKATRDCEIVHFHQSSDSFGYDAVKRTLESIRDRKKVVTVYGLSPDQKKDGSLNRVYNDADAVIVSTNYIKHILIKDGVDTKRIHVIPYGATLKPIDGKPRSGAIMFSGAPLIDVKGFAYLAEGLRILKKRGQVLNLKMHGFYIRGHKEWAIDVARKESVEDQITWLSLKSEDDLMNAYQESLCCVIPYTDYPGCFPVTVAMANGTPVVGSDSMGIPEYVNGSGLVVKSKSGEALADGLERVLKDEALREKMGRDGRRVAEQKYSWDTLARQVHAVYEQVLAS
jgi:glycosyltransferase involved in cell wall biosynthesis